MQSSNKSSSGKLPKFLFKMELPKQSSKELCLGSLALAVQGQNKIIWQATSGYPPYQFEGSTTLKGRGPIPGCAFAQVAFYGVLTKGIYMPKVKGVEGTFYPITPARVQLKGMNIVRGDFGIHFDANIPGSAGCVVLRNQIDWDNFRKLMKSYENQGIECIQMNVQYS